VSALAWVSLAAAIMLAGGPHSSTDSLRPAGAAPFAALRRLGGRADRRRDPGLPLVLDLTAAALRSGRPLSAALDLAAPAAGPEVAETLGRVARLLRLGAHPAAAWSGVPPGSEVSPVVPVAVRSAASGLKLGAAFERLAVDLRAERAARAAAAAQRAGVVAMAPLAACFLPSFVCLGVIPVVAGIASTALHAAP
jgi:Flp pilus assembly protein TadB